MPIDLLVVLGIGIVVFASTNIDDIFLLMAFFADPACRARHVVAGQYLSLTTLTLISRSRRAPPSTGEAE